MGKAKTTLIKNALLMTTISILLRSAGLFYRGKLTGLAGMEGMGLYTLVQTAFQFAVTLATAGLHTAVTLVLSENTGKDPGKVMRGAFGHALLCGIISGTLLFIGAGWISANLLHDLRCTFALRILSFSLPIMAVSAILKGYFFSVRQAALPAFSDVLEQSVEMITVIGIFSYYPMRNLEVCCRVIALGTTVSELSSFLMLAGTFCVERVLCKRKARKLYCQYAPADHNDKTIASPGKRIRQIALPVTGTAVVGAGMRSAENALIPRGLQKSGMTHETALSVYGEVRGMALPLIFYPSALIQSFSALMIPELSEARAKGSVERLYPYVIALLRAAILGALLTSGMIWAFSGELASILCHDIDAAKILLILSPLIPLMYLEMISDGFLKGLNQQNTVLRYNLIDAAARLILTVILVPKFGFWGFMIMMYISNLASPAASFIHLLRVTGIRISWHTWVLKPALSAAFAAAAARWLVNLIGRGSITGIPSLAAAVFLYLLFAAVSLLLTGTLTIPRKSAHFYEIFS